MYEQYCITQTNPVYNTRPMTERVITCPFGQAARVWCILFRVHVNFNHSCGFCRSASVVNVEKVAVECVDIISHCSWQFIGNPKRLTNFLSLYYFLSGKPVAMRCAIVNFCSSRVRCTSLIDFPFRTIKHSFVLFWKEFKPKHVTK